VRIMVVDRGIPVFFREVFLGEDAALSDMRKIDLSGCFLRAEAAGPVRRGSAPRQREPAGLIRTRGPPSPGDGPDRDDPGHAEDALREERRLGRVYASLGASTQPPENAPPALNLAAAGRVTHEERQTARDILIAGAVAALILAGAGLSRRRLTPTTPKSCTAIRKSSTPPPRSRSPACSRRRSMGCSRT